MNKKPSYEELEKKIKDLEKESREKQKIEKTLLISQEKMNSLIKGIPIPTYIWKKSDNDFILTDFNSAAMETTAQRIAHFKGHKASDMYDHMPEIIEDMATCYKTRKSIKHEMNFHFRSTGKSKFLDVTYGFIPPDIVVIHTEDISNRKQTEQKLHISLGRLEEEIEKRTEELVKTNRSLQHEISERKAAVKQIQKKELRFRTLTEHLQDIISRYDRDYRHLYINKVVNNYSSMKADEIIGKTIFELDYPEEDIRFWKKNLDTVFNSGTPLRVEIPHRSGMWFDWLFIPEISESGRTETVIVSGREISEIKKTEFNLEKSERLFRTFVDSSKSAIIIIQDERIIYHNQALLDITGYTKEDISAMRYHDLVHGDMKEIVTKRAEDRLVGIKAPEHYQIKILHKNGQTKWVDYSATIHEYEGKPAIFSTAYDITERVLAKEGLKESEEKYRTILESMEEAYFEVDLSGNLTFFNDALSKMTGYTRKELEGMGNREYTSAKTAKKMFHVFNKVYNTGVSADISNYEVIRKTGESVFLELSASLLKDKNGQPIGFRGIVRDNTQRRRAEKEKRELEHQLQQALRIEAIGTLAGGIAHDFNNLLTGIQGNLSIMKLNRTSFDQEYERIELMEGLVKSGAELTKQLLGFAMGGKYIVKTCDLNEIIDSSLKMIDRTKKYITIRKIFQEDLWTVDIDKGQIEQVLLNLYVNAAHAMPEGGQMAIVTKNRAIDSVKAKKLDLKAGSYIKISVSDTGIGMDKKTLDRIFEPFFTTKEMGRGTGLGLASAYGIIKNHKGKISVCSKIGAGTTFDIYLPASMKEKSCDDLPQEKIFTGTETILFIDDEAPVRAVGNEILRELGYIVITAESGKKAIEIYKEHSDAIDMVILDMIMPEMGGSETFAALKKINPDIKVLLASGYSMDEHTEKIIKNGSANFIQKPFSLPDLSQMLHIVLGKN